MSSEALSGYEWVWVYQRLSFFFFFFWFCFVHRPSSQPTGGRGCYCSSYQWEIQRNTQIEKTKSVAVILQQPARGGYKRKKERQAGYFLQFTFKKGHSWRRYQIQTTQFLSPCVFSALIYLGHRTENSIAKRLSWGPPFSFVFFLGECLIFPSNVGIVTGICIFSETEGNKCTAPKQGGQHAGSILTL